MVDVWLAAEESRPELCCHANFFWVNWKEMLQMQISEHNILLYLI